MRIGIFGTGNVGRALGEKFSHLGHDVRLGSRDPSSSTARVRAAEIGAALTILSPPETAAFGELLVNATPGAATLELLSSVPVEYLADKVLIDTSVASKTGAAGERVLIYANDDSFGEQLQAAHPELRVVKSLNSMHVRQMVDPASIPGPHNIFIAGNDTEARAAVFDLLTSMGWPNQAIIDLGDITASRATEAYALMFFRLLPIFKTPNINIAILHS